MWQSQEVNKDQNAGLLGSRKKMLKWERKQGRRERGGKERNRIKNEKEWEESSETNPWKWRREEGLKRREGNEK